MAAEESNRRGEVGEKRQRKYKKHFGLGRKLYRDARREQIASKRIWFILVICFLYHVPLFKLKFSILPFSSLLFSPNAISSCHHLILFPSATHPHFHVLKRLPLIPGAASAAFVYAPSCTTIKSEKDFSFPFLSVPNYMRQPPER